MDYRICPVSDNFALPQGVQELILAIEFGHLYVSMTYLAEIVGVTASTHRNAVFFSKEPSFD